MNKTRLKQYLDLRYNVLFSGRHGVGKTSVIKDVFEKAGVTWKYWSASTMDPWVDFIGVPKVINDPEYGDHLSLVQPLFMKLDEIEVFFFDELNRAPDKVLNAIMELIQFKSINGRKLKNLKAVWAAINPEDDDDTYSVNHLDPAHIDRFHVKIDVPFDVDKEYFISKYPSIGEIFINWWKSIPEDIQVLVSPRRLDYAADAYMNNCRLEDFLPHQSNVKKLRSMLKIKPLRETIKSISNKEDAIKILSDVNNVTSILDMVKQSDDVATDFFTKYGSDLPKEMLQPFIGYIQAHKAGLEDIKTFDELLYLSPAKEGDMTLANVINNADMNKLCVIGSIELQLVELMNKNPSLVNNFAGRMMNVLRRYTPSQLNGVIYKDNRTFEHTNFAVLLECLCLFGRSAKYLSFSPVISEQEIAQIKSIIAKLHRQ